MANNMTKAALNKRAINAAGTLNYWAAQLSEELSKQTLPPEKRPGSIFAVRPQQSKTITLGRIDLENLIHHLHYHAEELRKFTWKP
jgi:hypothetical protein